MKVKELEKTVNVAWSPPAQHPILLAAGTAAQQLDASFSTTASLELHALNLGEPGVDMQLRASAPSEQRFHKVVWGTNGTIVGGCDGGLMQIYHANKLLAGEKSPSVRQDKHNGPVRALDFNPFQPNLLATGASDSEIFIWDLNNINTHMTPGTKAQPAEDVAWISWNKQVQHILASTFAQRCIVWDLRKSEPIIKLSDSMSRIRWKVVSWHPDIATQLCLASEEDIAPVIQLWDLRFATAPIRSLESHQKGVLSIAWCMQDPDLLLSCGKDNRILCWNPNSNIPGGEIVCEVATTTQWNFDVAWCPRNPALISSCSFDGHVSVYSLTGGTQPEVQTSNKIADSFPGMDNYIQATPPQPAPVLVDLRKPPKWLRRPCGASFGFGGKLVTFEYDRSAQAQPPVNPQQPGFVQQPGQKRFVNVSQIVTEEAFVARSQVLETALQQGDYLDFCRTRSSTSRTSHEQFLWECLRTNFEPNPSSSVLSLLGFNVDEVNAKLNRAAGQTENSQLDNIDGITDRIHNLSSEPKDAFDEISASLSPHKRPDLSAPFKISTGDDADGLLCQALLLGNIEAAVELCLQEDRSADAIILAMTGGSDLLARTQFKYFQKNKGYLSTLMAAVVTEDWSQVIASCDLDSWKEAVAAAVTHTQGEEFSKLCEQLGQRLEMEAGGIHKQQAQLCYTIAGNVERLVQSWVSSAKVSSPEQIQGLVELITVLRTAVELKGRTVDISGFLADTLSKYAELLASQGNLPAALSYLNNSQDEQMLELRERLCVALGYKPIQSQVQQVQQQQANRMGNNQSHRGSISYSTRQGSSSYYGQTIAQNMSAVPAPASYVAPSSYNPPQPNLVPTQSIPANKPLPTVPSLPPVQPLTNVPPLHTQPMPTVPGPSASPGLPRAPSVSGGSNRKYVIDPSLQTGSLGYNSSSFAPMGSSFNQPNLYNPSGFGNHTDMYNSGTMVPSSTPAPMPTPPAAAVLQYSNQAPPGWNDPPALKSTPRQQLQPKTDLAPPAPITHPIFGSVPQETAPPVNNMNGSYNDPRGGYGLPPQQPNMYQPPNAYQPQMMQAPNIQAMMQTQILQPQENVPPVTQIARAKPEPPPPKAPIPEEHIILQTVLNELRNRCFAAANNPQSKRKLEDVSRKLEALYDALREQKLSDNTLQSLHQLIQLVQAGDYTTGLVLHTQLVSGPDFSQISSFMPGLKVLLQSALQLNVYLQ